jgi:hypothetical protein
MAAAYFSPKTQEARVCVMKKPRPAVSNDPGEDGLSVLRAMATDVLRRRARTGGQAALAALRKLGIAPGA